MKCFFGHKWSAWEMYEERGTAVLGRLSGSHGMRAEYAETRQIRSCQRCGRTQDEYIKDGPMHRSGKPEAPPRKIRHQMCQKSGTA